MRRRRRVRYHVQDTGLNTSIWYRKGKWFKDLGDSIAGSTNMILVKTMKRAYREACRINALGGRALIMKIVIADRTERHIWIRGFVPWT